jgi:excisionase family DNA binding protein
MCPQCKRPATGAIFVPSLSEAEYVVAVCGEHDLMGNGERFTFDALAQSPQSFLAAFDRQLVFDVDPELRGWLVAHVNGETAPLGLLTANDVAVRLNKSVRTVERYVAEGKLKAFQPSGPKAHIRVSTEALEAFIKAESKPRKPRTRVQAQPSDVF